MDARVGDLSSSDRALVRRELTAAQQALAAAGRTSTALETLSGITSAVEVLTATQHELVNLLLDHGASWSSIAGALSTSSAAVQRRYPRRSSRELRSAPEGAPGPGGSRGTGSADQPAD